MQRRTTKVNSIGARLGYKNEFDEVTSCTSVRSSGESKVGILDSENRATLDRHNVGADELTTAIADASDWSCSSFHGSDDNTWNKAKVRICMMASTDRVRTSWRKFSDTARCRVL
jgi:hypothetical protein